VGLYAYEMAAHSPADMQPQRNKRRYSLHPLGSPHADALRQDYSEAERRERFSFALARTLDMGPERMQQLLYTRSTAERLRASEELVLEGRAYLAARSTLRDTF